MKAPILLLSCINILLLRTSVTVPMTVSFRLRPVLSPSCEVLIWQKCLNRCGRRLSVTGLLGPVMLRWIRRRLALTCILTNRLGVARRIVPPSRPTKVWCRRVTLTRIRVLLSIWIRIRVLLRTKLRQLRAAVILLVSEASASPAVPSFRLVSVRNNTLPTTECNCLSLLRPDRSILKQRLVECLCARVIRARLTRPASGECSLRVMLVPNDLRWAQVRLICLRAEPNESINRLSLGGKGDSRKCVDSSGGVRCRVLRDSPTSGPRLTCVI